MKKGDQRRQAIIEAAERLFYKNGYEKTSVQDVLDVLNLSKGGFYHHFDSKLLLLDAICSQKVDDACVYAKEAVAAAEGGAVNALNALLSHAGLINQPDTAFIGLVVRVAYGGEGALLRDSLKRGYIRGLLPIAREVLLTGYKEGAFHAAYPEKTAEILLDLGACLTDRIGFLMAEQRNNPESAIYLFEEVNAYRHAVETLLGAPYGSVDLYQMESLIQLIKELNQQDKRLSDALASDAQ